MTTKPRPKPPLDPIAKAIYNSFLSDCEVDQSWNQAGVTDGLFAIARAIYYLANAIRVHPKPEGEL